MTEKIKDDDHILQWILGSLSAEEFAEEFPFLDVYLWRRKCRSEERNSSGKKLTYGLFLFAFKDGKCGAFCNHDDIRLNAISTIL